MSLLIPERPLIVSPTLAATIGLEEALLLQLMHDLAQLQQGEEHRNHTWFSLTKHDLTNQLPFWDEQELQRIISSLRDKGVIALDSPPLAYSEQLRFSFEQPVAAQPAPRAPNQTDEQPRRAATLPRNWHPGDDQLQLLELNHAIPRQFALDQLEEFILYWRDRGAPAHSWSSKFHQHVLRQWRHHQGSSAIAAPHSTEQGTMQAGWWPSEDALEILQRSGVNSEFIEDTVPEFVLYWQERGMTSNSWNSKFIAHIRRQWARYQSALEHSTEPHRIPDNWQPSEDLFDILKMANIDASFARQLVPEFILFWKDTNQLHRSWNSKFLQHVKYQWATRHHMGAEHATQRRITGTADRATSDTFQRLTDRSWAAGIVDE